MQGKYGPEGTHLTCRCVHVMAASGGCAAKCTRGELERVVEFLSPGLGATCKPPAGAESTEGKVARAKHTSAKRAKRHSDHRPTNWMDPKLAEEQKEFDAIDRKIDEESKLLHSGNQDERRQEFEEKEEREMAEQRRQEENEHREKLLNFYLEQ